jgi:DNA polymerase-1
MPEPDASNAGGTGRPSLYIVDAMNFLFRAFHALPPLKTTKGVHTGAIYGLCQMILRIEREQRPDTPVCRLRRPRVRTFARQIYTAYKAHRPAHAAGAGRAAGMVRHVIELFGLTQLEVPGFEADDIIATLTGVARAAGMDVVICSSDKDLTQLCGGGLPCWTRCGTG